jgi:hypothetical protein
MRTVTRAHVIAWRKDPAGCLKNGLMMGVELMLALSTLHKNWLPSMRLQWVCRRYRAMASGILRRSSWSKKTSRNTSRNDSAGLVAVST